MLAYFLNLIKINYIHLFIYMESPSISNIVAPSFITTYRKICFYFNVS